MNVFTNSVPLWVSILFIICLFVPVFMIATVVKKGVNRPQFNSKTKRLPIWIVVFFTAYYLYVTLMSTIGIFQVNSLPPRILMFTAIPLALFYFLLVFRTQIFWTILQNVRLSDLVRIHIFRFVGIFFIWGWYYGLLPKSFAFIAGIGDIVVAVTAIFIAQMIDKKAKNYKKFTLIWNIIGFWDMVSVLISAVYITQQAMKMQLQDILEITKFPFCLLPAFAPATIIFLHICIFKKLKMEK